MLENILSLRRLYIFPIIQPKRWKINKLGYNRLLTHCVSSLCCGWLTGDFLILYCSAAVAPPPVGARGVLLTRVKCAPRRCGAGVWRPLGCRTALQGTFLNAILLSRSNQPDCPETLTAHQEFSRLARLPLRHLLCVRVCVGVIR